MIMVYYAFTDDTSYVPAICISYADTKENTFKKGLCFGYSLFFVLSGKGVFNGTKVHAGQGFFVYANTINEWYADEADPWRYVWIDMRNSYFSNILELFRESKNSQVFHYDYIDEAEAFAKKIITYNNTQLPPLKMAEMCLRFIGNHTSDLHDKNIKAKEYVRRFVSYIDNNFFRGIKIENASTILGLSPQYLRKICKEHLGVSPKQYLNRRKMSYAEKLLKETDITISDIAYSLGFEDPFVFTRFFSSQLHISPTEYRTQNREI